MGKSKRNNKAGILNVVLKGNTFWYHKRVPKDLFSHFDNKQMICVNLKTSDVRVAKKRRDRADLETLSKFQRLRDGGPMEDIESEGRKWRDEVVYTYVEDAYEIDDDMKSSLITDRAMDIEKEQGLEVAQRFARVAFGTAFDSFVDDWCLDSQVAPKTEETRHLVIREFLKFVPSGIAFKDINRALVARYVSYLKNTRDLHRKTCNNKIQYLQAYWRWLIRRGHIEEQLSNPFTDQSIPKPSFKAAHKDQAKRPWTDTELASIMRALKVVQEDGDAALRDYVLIAALSGMRIAEIGTLLVGDCLEGGVFDLRDSKSPAGIRKVPIHPELVPIVERRTVGRGKGEPLFEDRRAFARGPGSSTYRSDIIPRRSSNHRAVSKRFGRLCKQLFGDLRAPGARQSPVDFHSLRRWFITKAEQAGQTREIVEAVVGHKRDGESFGRYSGGPSVEQRRTCIEAVKLPL